MTIKTEILEKLITDFTDFISAADKKPSKRKKRGRRENEIKCSILNQHKFKDINNFI